VKKILLVGIFVVSAFLLIYLVDSALLVSHLGINKPSPINFVWAITYATALLALQMLSAYLLAAGQSTPPSWLGRSSFGGRLALSFGITLALAAVIFFVWMVREL